MEKNTKLFYSRSSISIVTQEEEKRKKGEKTLSTYLFTDSVLVEQHLMDFGSLTLALILHLYMTAAVLLAVDRLRLYMRRRLTVS
jgi:hypothetical protein